MKKLLKSLKNKINEYKYIQDTIRENKKLNKKVKELNKKIKRYEELIQVLEIRNNYLEHELDESYKYYI